MLTTLNPPPRVALFPDTFEEANGVATLSRHLAGFARTQGIPFLLVRGGRQTKFTRAGSLETLELKRSPAAFPLDKGLDFDPLLNRHKQLVTSRLAAFKPDLIHITGPGDLGWLGLWLAHKMQIPLVASWHTNLHEYLARRLNQALPLLPKNLRRRASCAIERESLRALLRFYRIAKFTMAPNQTSVDMLQASTRKPSFLMEHGVDLNEFSPAPEWSPSDRPFCIGYVGRLTAEKNVRELAEIERRLIAAGERNYQFLIVGEGGQQKWLDRHLKNAEFPGVLRGSNLTAAYQRLDAFVFPSRTDTFGLVLLEALASGLPVILAPEAGARVGIENGISGFLTEDFAASIQLLMHDEPLRKRIGCAARQLASTHSWDQVFEHLYTTYEAGLARLRPVLTL